MVIADAELSFIMFYNRWLGVEGKLLRLPPPQLETRLLKGDSCPSYHCSLLITEHGAPPVLVANLAESLARFGSGVGPSSGCSSGQRMDLIAQIIMGWQTVGKCLRRNMLMLRDA